MLKIRSLGELFELSRHLGNFSGLSGGPHPYDYPSDSSIVSDFLEETPVAKRELLRSHVTGMMLQQDLINELLQQALDTLTDGQYPEAMPLGVEGEQVIQLDPKDLPRDVLEQLGLSNVSASEHPLNVDYLDQIYQEEAGNVVQGEPQSSYDVEEGPEPEGFDLDN